jgi:hypothetical protein
MLTQIEILFANFYNWAIGGFIIPVFSALGEFLFGDLGENDTIFLIKFIGSILMLPFLYAIFVRWKGGMFWASFWNGIKELRWVALSTALSGVGLLLLVLGDTFIFGLLFLPIGVFGYFISYERLRDFAYEQLEYKERFKTQ